MVAFAVKHSFLGSRGYCDISNVSIQRAGGHEPRWTLRDTETLEQLKTSKRTKTTRRLRWNRSLDRAPVDSLVLAQVLVHFLDVLVDDQHDVQRS